MEMSPFSAPFFWGTKKQGLLLPKRAAASWEGTRFLAWRDFLPAFSVNPTGTCRLGGLTCAWNFGGPVKIYLLELRQEVDIEMFLHVLFPFFPAGERRPTKNCPSYRTLRLHLYGRQQLQDSLRLSGCARKSRKATGHGDQAAVYLR